MTNLIHPEITVKNVRGVFLVGIIYFVIGTIISWHLNRLCELLPHPPNKEQGLSSKDVLMLSLQIALMVGLVCATVFIMRLYVAQMSTRILDIPTQEIKGSVVLAFSFMFFLAPCIHAKVQRLLLL